MKNLNALLTILIVATSSTAFSAVPAGVPTSGHQAIQQVLQALGKDVLYGETPQHQPCVVEVVAPNRYHSDTEIRVYLGTELDDVPEYAAWISMEPTDQLFATSTRQGTAVKAVEHRPDEEGLTTISSQITIYNDPGLMKKWVIVNTNASYVAHTDSTLNKPPRISKMSCLIGK